MWKDLISGTTALVYFLGHRKIILTYKKCHLIGIALLSLSCVCNFVPDAPQVSSSRSSSSFLLVGSLPVSA